MKKRQVYILSFIFLSIVFSLSFVLLRGNQSELGHARPIKYSDGALSHDGVSINVAFADTLEERILGLSRQESIGANEGLLFKFDDLERHGIWMRDMNFAIDIVWFDKEMQVVDIKENADPSSFRSETDAVVFRPKVPALYVLELPAGFVRGAGVEIGDVFLLKEKNSEK